LHVLAGAPLPVGLREIGASAGLNLRADAFRYAGADGSVWGPEDPPVRLDPAWTAAPPLDAPVRVVDRVGCDPHPIDATTPEGELRLASFVWPDQVERFTRLRGAVEVARRVPAEVVRAGAA